MCKEFISVKRSAVDWLKDKYPLLAVRAGFCENIAGRLYIVTIFESDEKRIEKRIEKLMACVREARRLGNMTVKPTVECDLLHKTMDELLAVEPLLDDPNDRFDNPSRTKHKEMVNRLMTTRVE